MLSHVHSRRLIAVIFLGALLLPQTSHAEDAAEPTAQATPAPTAPPVAVAPVLNPEEAALRAIQEEGQRQVAAIVQEMAGLQPGQALRDLQARIVQIKRDSLVQFLTARAGFDRARGDEAAALQAEKVIEQIVHPAPPPAEGGPQLPDKSAVTKGGRS
jgi:hypothetical protein